MRALLFFLFVIFTTTTMAQNDNLDDFKWRNRIVLVNTSEDTKLFAKQIKMLAVQKKEMAERKIILLKSTDYVLTKSVEGELSKSDIILIGLDGTIQRSRNTPYTAEELFMIIDSMPMRRSEMKKSG